MSIFQNQIHIPRKFMLIFKESETKFNRNIGRHEMGHPREERESGESGKYSYCPT